MKLIEGVLIDRMGYKPKRVDEKLLESLRMRIESGSKCSFKSKMNRTYLHFSFSY